MASSGGGSPVWLTVIVARVAGGFAAGMVGAVTFASVASRSSTFGPGAPAVHFSPWLLFAPVAIGALATGLAIHLLLPRMSGMNVGVFQAIVAAGAGSLFSLVVVLLFSHNILTGGGSASLVLLGGSTILVSMFNWILAIAITTWMVTSAATGMETRRGKEVTSQHSWSDIDDIDREGRHIEDLQAERGYWGAMDDPKPDPGPGAGPDQPDPDEPDPWRDEPDPS